MKIPCAIDRRASVAEPHRLLGLPGGMGDVDEAQDGRRSGRRRGASGGRRTRPGGTSRPCGGRRRPRRAPARPRPRRATIFVAAEPSPIRSKSEIAPHIAAEPESSSTPARQEHPPGRRVAEDAPARGVEPDQPLGRRLEDQSRLGLRQGAGARPRTDSGRRRSARARRIDVPSSTAAVAVAIVNVAIDQATAALASAARRAEQVSLLGVDLPLDPQRRSQRPVVIELRGRSRRRGRRSSPAARASAPAVQGAASRAATAAP